MKSEGLVLLLIFIFAYTTTSVANSTLGKALPTDPSLTVNVVTGSKDRHEKIGVYKLAVKSSNKIAHGSGDANSGGGGSGGLSENGNNGGINSPNTPGGAAINHHPSHHKGTANCDRTCSMFPTLVTVALACIMHLVLDI